ncbi:MAG: pyridoxal phosphate-dependent aminotransferase [Polyangiales bacterium]
MIIEVGRQAKAAGALDLALGAPDAPLTPPVRAAAVNAMASDLHQYICPEGWLPLRQQLAQAWSHRYDVALDPETQVTITCGASEALSAVIWALLDPGDRVAIFEPFYEGHYATLALAGVQPCPVPLDAPTWSFNPAPLVQALRRGAKAVLLCTPSNPCGKVFRADELASIHALCARYGAWCISDETYEAFVYDDRPPTSLLQCGLDGHVVVLGGLGKTLAATGWRIGYVFADAATSAAVRTVHEALTVVAPVPLQVASAWAWRDGAAHRRLAVQQAAVRRLQLVDALRTAGLSPAPPEGGLCLLAELPRPHPRGALGWAEHLIAHVGVAAAPGSAFFAAAERGQQWLRFVFNKSDATLRAAQTRLSQTSPDWLQAAAIASPPKPSFAEFSA